MTPAAQEKLQEALACIERAQVQLDCALQSLSRVCHMADAYTRLGRLYDRTHAEWFRIREAAERRAERLCLDSEK